MLQVINKTPFEVDFCPVTGPDGYDVLLVFLSASFDVNKGKWHVSKPQMHVPLTDDYWDTDNLSSLRYPSQLTIDKPATDVIVNGSAVAPGNKPVTSMPVAIEVGSKKVELRVFGERVWYREAPSMPQPFTTLPLRWENAYGGTEFVENEEQCYEHNPLGMGWRPDGIPAVEYHGLLMPHIEWPGELLRSPADRPRPAGLAAVSANTPMRAKLSGSYDSAWEKQQAPFMPVDFDPRFYNSAIPELQFPGYLKGNEGIRLTGFTPDGAAVLRLPGIQPTGLVQAIKQRHPLAFALQTLVIDADTMTVRLFWQARAPILRTLAEIDEIKVQLMQ